MIASQNLSLKMEESLVRFVYNICLIDIQSWGEGDGEFRGMGMGKG